LEGHKSVKIQEVLDEAKEQKKKLENEVNELEKKYKLEFEELD